MIVKMNIPRLLGSSDDKEKIGAARPEVDREEIQVEKIKMKQICYHQLNRR